MQPDIGDAERVAQTVRGLRGYGRQVVRRESQLQRGGLGGGEPLQVLDHVGQPQDLVAERRDARLG